jgi:hypothetical protein
LSRGEENAAIVKPLSEIGRVQARTPYCAALARARPGIDAAIRFEYAAPGVAKDFREFRLDSYLNRARSIEVTGRDVSAMTNLAGAGMDEVRALRTAASAESDPEKRQAMLDFAAALDSAKTRQVALAKAIARLYSTLSETPIRDSINTAKDDHGAHTVDRAPPRFEIAETSAEDKAAAAKAKATPTPDPLADFHQTEQLFNTFAAEKPIREDLKKAMLHGNKAVQLAGCSGV